MQIRMLRLTKEKYFLFFNKFQLILLCLIVPKMLLKKMSSAIVLISALRVEF